MHVSNRSQQEIVWFYANNFKMLITKLKSKLILLWNEDVWAIIDFNCKKKQQITQSWKIEWNKQHKKKSVYDIAEECEKS